MLRFFFDVDGVVLDFESTYIKIIDHMFRLNLPDDYQPSLWDFSDLLSDDQMDEAWDYFIKSPHFQSLLPLVHTDEFNSILNGYPVHFITNIPPWNLDQRRINLEQAGFQFESVHCAGFLSFPDVPPVTKSEMLQRIIKKNEIAFFLDDHPKNCIDVCQNIPEAQVCLLSRPFNKDFVHPQIHRKNNWDEVFAFIIALQN